MAPLAGAVAVAAVIAVTGTAYDATHHSGRTGSGQAPADPVGYAAHHALAPTTSGGRVMLGP
jgi:hypothetical protein